MNRKEQLKFIIVGQIDHGKSTLIGRILHDTGSVAHDKLQEMRRASSAAGKSQEFAFLLDHLEEERLNAMTIDTTQVFFKTKKRDYVIIDAPGHVEFIKNMITGASQAEAAVLIIDVSDGIREQTKRHAYLLSLLGIMQVVVAINKMDLVLFAQDCFDKTKDEAEKFLEPLGIAPLSCIPISALSGENIVKKSKKMKWFGGPTVLESLDTIRGQESMRNKPLLFSVQDSYLINDKRIIVGRIESGSMRRGQAVSILPSRKETKIKSIEKFLSNADVAYAGDCIGLTTEDPVMIGRGAIVCASGEEPVSTGRLQACIFWMSDEDCSKGGSLDVKCATQETSCVVESIVRRIDSSSLNVIEKGASVLKKLEVGEVVLKLKKPIVIKPFSDVRELGRFVLTDDEQVSAAGIARSSIEDSGS